MVLTREMEKMPESKYGIHTLSGHLMDGSFIHLYGRNVSEQCGNSQKKGHFSSL